MQIWDNLSQSSRRDHLWSNRIHHRWDMALPRNLLNSRWKTNPTNTFPSVWHRDSAHHSFLNSTNQPSSPPIEIHPYHPLNSRSILCPLINLFSRRQCSLIQCILNRPLKLLGARIINYVRASQRSLISRKWRIPLICSCHRQRILEVLNALQLLWLDVPIKIGIHFQRL
jgi:hypothetical protein